MRTMPIIRDRLLYRNKSTCHTGGSSIKRRCKTFYSGIHRCGVRTLAVCGGYFLNSHQAIETRLSLGNVHQMAFVGQLHLGTNYFILDKLNIMNKGLYCGGYLKFWDYYNKLTEIHFFNVVPYLTIGYWHEFEPIILDFRINQTLAIFSWSSLEHTSSGSDWFFSPWPAFVPVLPTITFTVGYRF